jgi:flagellar protein FlgJ
MEVSAAYSVYAGNSTVPPVGRALSAAAANGIAGAESDFSRMLDRAQSPAAFQAEAFQAPASRRPVIDKTDKLYEQCQELETFLMKTLVKSMRSTIQKSNLIDTGFAGEVYEDMLYDEYTKDFTRNAGLGLAETAYLELTGQRGVIVENRVSVQA